METSKTIMYSGAWEFKKKIVVISGKQKFKQKIPQKRKHWAKVLKKRVNATESKNLIHEIKVNLANIDKDENNDQLYNINYIYCYQCCVYLKNDRNLIYDMKKLNRKNLTIIL